MSTPSWPALTFLTLLAWQAAAQCGPGGTKPYPPGETSCPSLGDGMGPHTMSGGMTSGGPGGPGATATGESTGQTYTCSAPPCAASLLGKVGLTTATGTDSRSGITFAVDEDIYGPFEAGFSSQQDGILEGLGCNPGSLGHVAGGIDTYTAEQMVAQQCSITLPRVENNQYVSLLDECGGHTRDYHFHEKLSCLYSMSGGHSAQVGKASDDQYIYGKWEDYSSSTLPLLDACGGHFGVTPDSGSAVVYHYHVQDNPPFTLGCFGPKQNNDGTFALVTVAECRALYSGCGNGDTVTVTLPSGAVQYDPWCPCYDGGGSNVGNVALAVFGGSSTSCTGTDCTGFVGDGLTIPASAPAPSPAPPAASDAVRMAPQFLAAMIGAALWKVCL
mmetsp:Transcript_44489/g.100534  ORF Transcript_44489/g.100534 Transcript_44489/m.100534 type:complete len:387 (-) Transcript_44489:105-1265(-)